MTQTGVGTGSERPCAVPGVDLQDNSRFTEWREHEMFDVLRAAEPVSWHRRGDDPADGFWALMRHADVTTANRDWATYTTREGTLIGETGGFLGLGEDMLSLANDPPNHTKMRLIVNRVFTRGAIARLADDVRAIVDETLADAEAAAVGGVLDLSAEIAGRLPARVIGSILGVPAGDWDQLGAWTSTLSTAADPGEREVVDGQPDMGEAGANIFGYASELAADAGRAAGDDVVSKILLADVDGRRLTEMEFALFFFLLYAAGTQTTHAAAAGGAYELLRDRSRWDDCRRDPGLWPSAVEEMVRWTTPVAYFRRTATTDAELGGRHIRAGEPVCLWFSAANRDPEVFTDPQRFDVRRDPNPHVAFGAGGPHYCLGVHLARLELTCLFSTLADRYPDLALAGEPTWHASNFAPGVATLPVALGARGR